MSRHADYLAVYDLSDDRERDRTSDVLAGYGFRVQFSVFELRLNAAMKARLLARLAELDLKSGWMALYRRQHGAKPDTLGRVPERPLKEEDYAWVI